MAFAKSAQTQIYTVCYSTKYFKNQLHKKQKIGKSKGME